MLGDSRFSVHTPDARSSVWSSWLPLLSELLIYGMGLPGWGCRHCQMQRPHGQLLAVNSTSWAGASDWPDTGRSETSCPTWQPGALAGTRNFHFLAEAASARGFLVCSEESTVQRGGVVEGRSSTSVYPAALRPAGISPATVSEEGWKNTLLCRT